MPLYPPARLVEHPADVVIDVFGAFLGKRSERMVIRWREPFGVGRRKDEEFPPTSGPSVLPQPLVSDQPVGDQPVGELPADAQPGGGEDDTLQVSNGWSSSIEPDSSDRPHENSGVARPRAGSSGAHPADAAAAELLALWANDPAPPVATVRPVPTARLAEQLDRLSEGSRADCTGREWQERAVPMSRLRSVTISGRGVTISSDLIEALVERGIGLSFLSGRGQPVAQFSSPGLNGTVQTRRSQLAAYHTALGVQLAVEFIRGKLRNQKHQLQYSGKYLKSTDAARFERLEKKIAAIANLRKQLATFEAEELDRVRDKLMGFEGTGARLYWEGVALLLEGRAAFPGRQTRGAIDPINSALNYGYGILYGQVSAAIVNAGLELYAGFLHVDRAGKPALVLDLVEEFRAPVVDRVVLAMVNQGITLETDEHGLTAVTRRLVADRVLERIATAVPYEGKRWTLGSIIQTQARHLAVAVRGERVYRAFASRW